MSIIIFRFIALYVQGQYIQKQKLHFGFDLQFISLSHCVSLVVTLVLFLMHHLSALKTNRPADKFKQITRKTF